VPVQYNPNKPSQSLLPESSIESLLQTRAPKPQSESPTSADSVPDWVKPLLWFAVGAVMGRREALFWILHMGIFVVWIPAVFVAKARVGNVNRKDFWKVVLQGSPDWIRYMVYGFLGYAVLNFALFMLKAPTGSTGMIPPAEVWRGFSGHWMAFYSAALAILYAAARSGDDVRRCLNGHPVPPTANFCAQCGQPEMHT
jgi:hypothetical protein